MSWLYEYLDSSEKNAEFFLNSDDLSKTTKKVVEFCQSQKIRPEMYSKMILDEEEGMLSEVLYVKVALEKVESLREELKSYVEKYENRGQRK